MKFDVQNHVFQVAQSSKLIIFYIIIYNFGIGFGPATIKAIGVMKPSNELVYSKILITEIHKDKNRTQYHD